MSLDTILKRLPSHYKKTPDSNNYKLFSLIAKQIEDSEELYATIQRFWDVDLAAGVGLDRLGKDEGISRGSYDDETYRKLIKIEFIINMSEGDAEMMNIILDAYLGESFLYIEEGWENHNEPASFFVNVSSLNQDFPYPLLRRIKAAGVAAKVTLQQSDQLNIFTGGIINEWKRTTIEPIQFKMPNIAGEQRAIGYVSIWNKHTINPEVKHKWLITRVLY